MLACPRCGTTKPATQPICPGCGFAPGVGPGGPGALTLNYAGPLKIARGPESPPSSGSLASKRTLFGMPSTPAPPSSSHLPSEHKTMLGIARPGIAPLHPGGERPNSPHERSQPFVANEGARPPAARLGVAAKHEQPPERVPLSAHAVAPERNRRMPPWPLLTVLGAILLLAAGTALAFFWGSQGAIRAELGVGPDGTERLEVWCERCADGTVLSLGGASATFSGARARVVLEQPLSVGENSVHVRLSRPGEQSGSEIELAVPVEYRIRGDLEGLRDDPPVLRIHVHALADTSVIIDGRAVPLGPEGKGLYTFDAGPALTGAAAGVDVLERRLPYTITPPASAPQRGEVTLKVGIVPLAIEAPGERIVIETPNFILAGRTLRGGALSVAGRPITVDGTGRFAQLMNVSAVGETTIVARASAPDHAPRLYPIHIRRVVSLSQEAKLFARGATSSYAAVADGIQSKRGWAVAFEGELAEAHIEAHTTVMLLDVKNGCAKAACLTRVVHGARLDVVRGEKLAAYGHVAGAVDGPHGGSKIPELMADFVVKGAKE